MFAKHLIHRCMHSLCINSSVWNVFCLLIVVYAFVLKHTSEAFFHARAEARVYLTHTYARTTYVNRWHGNGKFARLFFSRPPDEWSEMKLMSPPIVFAAARDQIQLSWTLVIAHSDRCFSTAWIDFSIIPKHEFAATQKSQHTQWGARTFFNSSLTAVRLLSVYMRVCCAEMTTGSCKEFPLHLLGTHTAHSASPICGACVRDFVLSADTTARSHVYACGCASRRIRIRCTLPRTTFTRRRLTRTIDALVQF